MMKLLIVLALTVVTCKAAFLFGGGCKADSDCGTNGCCSTSIFGGNCRHRLGLGSRCSLTATASSSCTLQCAVGTMCMDESKLDVAVEPGFGNSGRCVSASSASVPVTMTTGQIMTGPTK